ncbi:transcriptional regulator NrdR [Desulfosarcina sp.]|nr:transcriptional regulator NrdR [Desulfosarcina sp.]
MKCPYCSNTSTKVLDSRETSDEVTRRRRECLKCAKRFTTYERIEMIDLFVLKKEGKREMFDREKVRRGVMKACEKRDIPLEEVEKLIDDVETEIRRKDSTEIKSKDVGGMVMKYLRKLDNVAYIRFASVYREFTDVESFEEELNKLLKKHRGKK